MAVTHGSTAGRQLIVETDLNRLMAELDRTKHDVFNARRKRLAVQEKLDTIKRTDLAMAQQQVEIEKARLIMEIAEDRDDKGKPKYGNDTLRAAALTQRMATDPAYQEAVATLRAVEEQVAKLQLELQECEDEIKSTSDLNWTLRTLVDGARAEILAVVSLDGPRIPAEITIQGPQTPITGEIRVTGLPAEIQLRAPDHLPHVNLIAPKEAA